MRFLTALLIPVVLWTGEINALENPAVLPMEAGVDEHLNDAVDLSLPFTRADGQPTTLGNLLLPDRPLILVPVYYTCPRLCGLNLDGVAKLLNELPLMPGRDFSLVTFSFDSTDTPEAARKKQAAIFEKLADPQKSINWHFLSGSEQSIQTLTRQVGFKFRRDNGEFAHTAMFVLLTPAGKISRYFYGVEHPAGEVRRALVEASQGKIGGTLDRVFLYCFRYDNINGRYTILIWNVIRVVCTGFAALVLGALLFMRLREKRA